VHTAVRELGGWSFALVLRIVYSAINDMMNVTIIAPFVQLRTPVPYDDRCTNDA
jgi:hypothetical protein